MVHRKDLEPKFEAARCRARQRWPRARPASSRRNNPMHNSVPYLFNDLMPTRPTYCTNISFRAPPIPSSSRRRAEMLRNQPLPVLNASVRIVHKEDVALTYAPEPAYLAGALHQMEKSCMLLPASTMRPTNSWPTAIGMGIVFCAQASTVVNVNVGPADPRAQNLDQHIIDADLRHSESRRAKGRGRLSFSRELALFS